MSQTVKQPNGATARRHFKEIVIPAAKVCMDECAGEGEPITAVEAIEAVIHLSGQGSDLPDYFRQTWKNYSQAWKKRIGKLV